MKINIYTRELGVGGLQNTLKNLLSELNSETNIHLYTFNKEKKVYKNQVNMTNWTGKGGKLKKIISFIRFKMFRPRKADIHITWNPYCKFSCYKAYKQKGKSVLWIHTDLIKSKREYYIDKCNYKMFDKVVAVSKQALKSIQELGFNNSTVIYNLIDKKYSNYGALKQTSKVYDFINVSRHINKHKDIKRYIDIASTKKTKKFLQIGDGIDYEENLKYSEGIDNVEFMGLEEPFEYYKQSKSYLLTSIVEGFPIVVIEALATGCDVYCTPIVLDFSDNYWSKYIGIINDRNELIKPDKKLMFNYSKYKSDVLKSFYNLMEEVKNKKEA